MTTERLRAPAPWAVGEVATLIIGWTSGLVLVLLSWYQVAGSATWDRQLAWVTAAVLGLVLAGASTGVWLLSGRRAVGARRRSLRLHERFDALVVRIPTSEHEIDMTPTAKATDDLVWAQGMTHFHRRECLLVQGKSVASMSRRAHERAARTSCGVCEP